MEPRLTGVPSGSVAPQHVAPPPHCPPLPSTPMGDTIIRRSLAPGSTMDRGRSGLGLMFPWERVLPMPCLIYRVLLGNATWAKEAQPLSSQRALCSKSLNTTHLAPGQTGLLLQGHTTSQAAQNWCLSHGNIHSPAPIRLHLPPQASPSGTPQSPSIGGLWRHSVPTGQQAGPEYIRHMQY